MKLLGKSAVLMAVAVAAAAVLASSAFEAVRPASPHTGDASRIESHESASHDAWHPDSPTPGFAPSNASWGAVFGANWR